MPTEPTPIKEDSLGIKNVANRFSEMIFWTEINFIFILYYQNGSNGKTQKCLEKIWRQTLEVSELLSKCKLRLSFQNHKLWHKTFLWTKHKVLIFYNCKQLRNKKDVYIICDHIKQHALSTYALIQMHCSWRLRDWTYNPLGCERSVLSTRPWLYGQSVVLNE